jgi:hypothetical protein
MSGVVREAFRKRGHDAWSCDLLPSLDLSPFHHIGDVSSIIDDCWDLVIAHPPCTYLSVSGLHWNKRRPDRQALTDEAAQFFMLFTRLTCKWAIENPIGCMSRLYRKPDQIVQPYNFGDDASKATCLWLNGLPALLSTRYAPGRVVEYKGKTWRRWANQTDSGQNRLGPSPTRATERSKTYPGIAYAMAIQWG